MLLRLVLFLFLGVLASPLWAASTNNVDRGIELGLAAREAAQGGRFDEALFVDWVRQASRLPGEKM